MLLGWDWNSLFFVLAVLSFATAAGVTALLATYHTVERARLPAAVRLSELDTIIGSKEGQLSELDRRVREREVKLSDRDQAEAEAEYWRSVLETAKAEYSNLADQRREIEQVREEYRQAVEELGVQKSALGDAQVTLDSFNQALSIAEAKRTTAEESLAEIEKAMTVRQGDIAKVEDQRKQLETAIERKTSALQEIEGKLGEAESALKQLQNVQEMVLRLERQREQLEAKIDEIGKQALRADELEERVSALQSEQTKLQLNLEGLTRSVADKRVESQSLDAHMAVVREAIEKSKAGKRDDAGGEPDDKLMLSDLTQVPNCLGRSDSTGRVIAHRSKRWEPAEEEALKETRKQIDEYGLTFPDRAINAFHTSLKTGQISPMTVLAGISGTGKSQLPQRYANAMGFHFLKIPVQPRWDSPQDLFGFFNYIEKRYRATELARALVHLDPFNWKELSAPFHDRMLMVLLDEMNLARIEYYFAEFLSRLEGRSSPEKSSDAAERASSEIEIDVRRTGKQGLRVYPGHNILFVGTMNEDESTLALSDKVLDRSNVLRFPKPEELKSGVPAGNTVSGDRYLPKDRWLSWIKKIEDMDRGDREHAAETVKEINKIMDRLGRPFGHRMNQSILHYVANYPGQRSRSRVDQALGDQIEQRILPKLRGVDVETNRGELKQLADISRKIGDESLSEAIDGAIDSAGKTTGGMFLWRGFSRGD
jgi:5-methylcytosine-specific restriction endonuclease McrBC GTP-binding regulatory subunit McrB